MILRSGAGHQVVGVISDTHGLLRPEVLRIFKGVTLILHAGDIGRPEVLDGLRELGPVVAVRGNNDTDEWAKRIPEVKAVKASGVSIYMLHDVMDLKGTPSAKKVQVVVSGHSHRPRIEDRDGILFLNPGSAGPRRFQLPISVARMTIHGVVVRAEIIELSTTQPGPARGYLVRHRGGFARLRLHCGSQSASECPRPSRL